MHILPTPSLDLLWDALLAARKPIQQAVREPLAAPFWSAADESYRTCNLRFMLVGRATRGAYDADEFLSRLEKSPEEALAQRKELNRQIIEQIKKRSPFWRAFARGSKSCGPADTFCNSVWTNISKIGYANRDVDYRLFQLQQELAEETLRVELEEYNPTVVHFAVGTLGGECIYRATGTKEKDWTPLAKNGPKKDIWFLNSVKFKAIWTRHPNRASRELVQAWDAKLQKLVEG